jgi:hypothetical protein
VQAVSTPSAAGSSGPALTPNAGYSYQRRNVERTTLYQLVRDHLETFYQAVEDGFASAPLPNFVRREFERFLDCPYFVEAPRCSRASSVRRPRSSL